MDPIQAMVEKTLQGVQEAQGDLEKALTTSSGLQGVDLDAPSKSLYPVLTPLRNRIPRINAAKGAPASQWKVISGIGSAGSPGVGEGLRNSEISYTVANKLASYKTLGRDDSVTREQEWQGRSFQDSRALSTTKTLQRVMVEEEDVLLGGNASLALGTPGTVTPAAAGTGATLPAATYFVYVVALPFMGYKGSSAPGTLSAFRSNKSAEASQAITLGQTLSLSVPAVSGAVAYAWFVGTTTGAANCKLEKITTINSVTFSAPLAGTGVLANTVTGDASTDALVYDGILPQIISGGGYVKVLANGTAGTGTGLTYDNAGGIVEIDDALQAQWDATKTGPDEILVSSQEARNINKKIMTAGGQPIFQFTIQNGAAQGAVTAGVVVANYLNKFTNKAVLLRVHPTCPAGTMVFVTYDLPEWYPDNNVAGLWDVHVLQAYYEEIYGQVARKWEHGVYHSDVLRGFLPAAQGIITNIGNA